MTTQDPKRRDRILVVAKDDELRESMVETLERPWIENKIRDEFNGYNYRELGLKYNKSESTIRAICKDIVNAKRRQPISGQLTLFEE